MIIVDGSRGEGGGQMVRSSVALAAALCKPVRIVNIRAGRKTPGLMRQHMTAVKAAGAVCDAKISGNTLGSSEITFEPSRLRGGEFHFAVGTAGSTALVLQAVLPPLMFADSPSVVTVEGGTHIAHSPPTEFLTQTLFPVLRRLGVGIELTLERYGFFPVGGGRVSVKVTPAAMLTGIHLHERKGCVSVVPRIIHSQLPYDIAKRELRVLESTLQVVASYENVTTAKPALSQGNCVQSAVTYDNITEVISCMGKLGVSAEAVAASVADQVKAYLATQAPVGEHHADQLMVPLMLAHLIKGVPSSYVTSVLSLHSMTNFDVITQVSGVKPKLAELTPLGTAHLDRLVRFETASS